MHWHELSGSSDLAQCLASTSRLPSPFVGLPLCSFLPSYLACHAVLSGIQRLCDARRIVTQNLVFLVPQYDGSKVSTSWHAAFFLCACVPTCPGAPGAPGAGVPQPKGRRQLACMVRWISAAPLAQSACLAIGSLPR